MGVQQIHSVRLSLLGQQVYLYGSGGPTNNTTHDLLLLMIAI